MKWELVTMQILKCLSSSIESETLRSGLESALISHPGDTDAHYLRTTDLTYISQWKKLANSCDLNVRMSIVCP